MRRTVAAAMAVGVLTVSACSSGSAGGSSGADGVAVHDPWARTTPPGVSVGVVYLEVTSGADDALLGATVDPKVAAEAELHEESSSGDMTSMQPVTSMPVTAATPLRLDPLGNHLMLVDLAAPLTAGEHFDVTLHFQHAGDQQVSVQVRDDAP